MSRKMIILILACLLASLALGDLGSQYVPVSRRYPGLVIGNDNSAVTVELVYDLTCTKKVIQVMVVRSSTKQLDK